MQAFELQNLGILQPTKWIPKTLRLSKNPLLDDVYLFVCQAPKQRTAFRKYLLTHRLINQIPMYNKASENLVNSNTTPGV